MSGRTVGRTGRGGETRGPGRVRKRRVRPRLLAAALALALATTGCDDIVKHVPWFAAMVDRPAIETYEQQPAPPPEGTVPVEGDDADIPLPAVDTASELENPLSGTEAEIARGDSLYSSFCLPCHGPEGRGQGPVVNHDGQHPGRFPFIPTLDLTAGTALDRSDAYIWGMMENGRGLMPDYERIPSEDRWYIVEYVRHLQRRAGAAPQTTARTSASPLASRADPGRSARRASGSGGDR